MRATNCCKDDSAGHAQDAKTKIGKAQSQASKAATKKATKAAMKHVRAGTLPKPKTGPGSLCCPKKKSSAQQKAKAAMKVPKITVPRVAPRVH